MPELLGIGVDVCGAARWERALRRTPGAVEAAFAAPELAWTGRDPARLALQWALKEAVVKALGRGFGLLGWRDVVIRRPQVELAVWAGEGSHAAARHLPEGDGLGLDITPPSAPQPIWPGDGITWRLWARMWRAAALAVVCAQRGPVSPRVALVVRRRPFARLERPARRRARSVASREAAFIAAGDLVPDLERTG